MRFGLPEFNFVGCLKRPGRPADRDQFIPVGKIDILAALVEHGPYASPEKSSTVSRRRITYQFQLVCPLP